jgi:serine/threonine protein kinase
LCEALDYAHSRGTVHRDLKPSNVLLDSDEDRGPMLTDFGFARLMGDSSVSLTLSGGILGTPAYIAPEVWELDKAEPPADIYALGCILYEVLTGEVLFAGKTPMQSMRAHDQGPQLPQEWAADVPEGIDAVLEKALARDPEDRYASGMALWHALNDLKAQARAAEEAAQQAAVAAQWREEAEAAMAVEEWSVAKMAAARWLAVVPDDPDAQEAQAEIKRQLEGPSTEEKKEEKDPPQDTVACPTCGYANRPGVQRCQACGHLIASQSELPNAASQNAASPLQSKTVANLDKKETTMNSADPFQILRKAPASLLWGLGGVVVLSGILALVMLSSASSKPEPTSIPLTDTPSPTPKASATNRPTSTSTPRPTNTATATPEPTQTPSPGDIVWSESFINSDSESLWDLWAGEDTSFQIENGKLIAEGTNPDVFSWTGTDKMHAELDLEIEATFNENREDVFLGILLTKDSGDEIRGCFVNGDGLGYCLEIVGEERDQGDVVEVPLSPAGDVNSLHLIRVGDQWTMYVNDQCLGSGEISPATKYAIGLAVGTDSSDVTAQVAYDNLILRVPDDQSVELLGCTAQPYERETGTTGGGGDTQAGSGNGLLRVEDQTGIGCILEFWGPAEHTLDVSPGAVRTVETVAGEYGWGLSGGEKLEGQADLARLKSGGVCNFTCLENTIRWGCNP